MGIYIKDLNMPNTCSECREMGLAHVEGIICDQDMPGDTPYNMCPLKEINLDDLIAKMDDNWEEPEINPCRGCRDYDGRGGCKSNGGCGRGEVENGI